MPPDARDFDLDQLASAVESLTGSLDGLTLYGTALDEELVKIPQVSYDLDALLARLPALITEVRQSRTALAAQRTALDIAQQALAALRTLTEHAGAVFATVDATDTDGA